MYLFNRNLPKNIAVAKSGSKEKRNAFLSIHQSLGSYVTSEEEVRRCHQRSKRMMLVRSKFMFRFRSSFHTILAEFVIQRMAHVGDGPSMAGK